MVATLDQATLHHVARAVDSLVDEFGDRYDYTEIQSLVRDSLAQLTQGAEINEFVPALTHRFARERLLASDRQRELVRRRAERYGPNRRRRLNRKEPRRVSSH